MNFIRSRTHLWRLFFSLAMTVLVCSPTQAEDFSEMKRGQLIFSGGVGFTVAPSYVFVSPQLEYSLRRHILIGPLVQAAIGDGEAIWGLSLSGRLLVGQHPRLRPSLEAGVGVSAFTSTGTSRLGPLLHFGMGFEYILAPNITIGSLIRANLAPPVQTVFLSWPLLVVRTIL